MGGNESKATVLENMIKNFFKKKYLEEIMG